MDPFVELDKKISKFRDKIHKELLQDARRKPTVLSESYLEQLRAMMIQQNQWRPSIRTERLCIRGRLSD